VSDRISIPALRKYSDEPFDPYMPPPGRMELAALVDAVEALHLWRGDMAEPDRRYERQVDDVLSRFDFGEET